ncbi:odorant receptor Or2-like [Schistocerca gregaria]|nr:odorant receptor Or2-like [Schistocerca gregaria]
MCAVEGGCAPLALGREEFLRLNVWLVRLLGLWWEGRPPWARAALLLLCLAALVSLQAAEMASIGLGDIGALTEVGTLTLASVNVGFQVAYLMRSQRRVARLVQQTREACARLGDGRAAAAELRLRQLTLGCVACCSGVGCVWAAGPLLADGDALPYRLWSPLDVTAAPGYHITYLLSVTILAPLVEAFVNLNALYLGLMVLTSARFSSLNSRFAAISKEKDGSGRLATAELARCVALHVDLLRFCNELSDVLSPVLLSQFGFTIVIICQTALQTTMELELSPRTMKFMGLLWLGISELFLYSYMGHKIMSQASDVQLSAYSCGWPDLDSSFKKSVSFIIQRAQKPLHFSIGKMYVLSLRTFVEMMRVSYAFFTLLQQVNGD